MAGWGLTHCSAPDAILSVVQLLKIGLIAMWTNAVPERPFPYEAVEVAAVGILVPSLRLRQLELMAEGEGWCLRNARQPQNMHLSPPPQIRPTKGLCQIAKRG